MPGGDRICNTVAPPLWHMTGTPAVPLAVQAFMKILSVGRVRDSLFVLWARARQETLSGSR
jgi:hypothetical protein